MKTEPNESAYPLQPTFNSEGQICNERYEFEGLTKREYFAAMALQGIIAAHNIYETGIDNGVNARTAVNAADALIKALNESQP